MQLPDLELYHGCKKELDEAIEKLPDGDFKRHLERASRGAAARMKSRFDSAVSDGVDEICALHGIADHKGT